jgi:hypothetical protein
MHQLGRLAATRLKSFAKKNRPALDGINPLAAKLNI